MMTRAAKEPLAPHFRSRYAGVFAVFRYCSGVEVTAAYVRLFSRSSRLLLCSGVPPCLMECQRASAID